MPTAAITVENLSKVYRIGVRDESSATLLGTAFSCLTAPWRNLARLRRLDTSTHRDADDASTLRALDDVSFEVPEGRVLGIVGNNGAGKSTLLKILSRITDPTSGRAIVRGRVSSLLEVGTGFHPDLSGRDNVYMNGTILGMTKREIDARLDAIVDFSGVEKFLDTPIKRYSSGMQLRLAFSVAAYLEPEVLIVDEVLAVGDAEFQRKCLGKMSEVVACGRTVLFVSHNTAAIEALCHSVVLLRQGRLVAQGEPEAILGDYLSSSVRDLPTVDLTQHGGRTPAAIRPVCRSVSLSDADGHPVSTIRPGDDLTVDVLMHSRERRDSCSLGLVIFNERQQRVATCHTDYQSSGRFTIAGDARLRCALRNVRLNYGLYSLRIDVSSRGSLIDQIDNAIVFQVAHVDVYGTGKTIPPSKSPYLPEVEWEVDAPHT